VGFVFAPWQSSNTQTEPCRIEDPMATPNTTQSRINIDLIAVAIALALAALIRFNIIPSISF
jgi:hypothetical protein